MFKAGDTVRIRSCADKPRAAGRTGHVIDEVQPTHLTDYRWTVHGVGWLIGPVLCTTAELELISRKKG